MYGKDLALALGLLSMFGVCGWWVVTPFRSRISFPHAVAPLAGMIMAALATLSASVLLNLPLSRAAVIAFGALSGSTLATVLLGRRLGREGGRARGGVLTAGVLATVVAVEICLCAYADLHFGSPGLQFMHGSDHLGYAHLVDWLKSHPNQNPRPSDPGDWYSSWPHFMLASDPRFGSIALLSLVAAVSGRSGAFSYDLACAVVLSAGAVGLAGLFGRTPASFLLLVVGLAIGFWFDWSRHGYFGKIVGHPASLLAAGLYLAWADRVPSRTPRPLWPLAVIAAVVGGAAVTFSGLLTALVLLALGATFLVFRLLDPGESEWGVRVADAREAAVGLGLVIGVSILSSGVIARPLAQLGGAIPWSWSTLASHALELESLAALELPSRGLVAGLAVLQVLLWLALVWVAWRRRQATAVALLTTPAIALMLLFALDARWPAMQLVGLYLAAALCGAGVLWEGPVSREIRGYARHVLWIACVATVALHVPRFTKTLLYFGSGDRAAASRFSLAETDELAAAIERGGGAYVDIPPGYPQLNIFVLVELGRRGLPLQWSAPSWNRILAYRRWPAPVYATRVPLRIVPRDDSNTGSEALVLRTAQLDLLRR